MANILFVIWDGGPPPRPPLDRTMGWRRTGSGGNAPKPRPRRRQDAGSNHSLHGPGLAGHTAAGRSAGGRVAGIGEPEQRLVSRPAACFAECPSTR
jgi:hypothetical protein